MFWIHLVMLLALCQFLAFGALVGRARGRYGIKAPATTGHDIFERYYRVQVNTLELLVVLLPALWIAASYWNAKWVAAAGAIYLIGRLVYLRAYIKDPATRELGFALSIVPIVVLLLAGLIGLGLGYLQGAPA